MKKFLILGYNGVNPFPELEKIQRTKKSKKEIFLHYRNYFDFVKVFEI
jgi:hypothetical protein